MEALQTSLIRQSLCSEGVNANSRVDLADAWDDIEKPTHQMRRLQDILEEALNVRKHYTMTLD